MSAIIPLEIPLVRRQLALRITVSSTEEVSISNYWRTSLSILDSRRARIVVIAFAKAAIAAAYLVEI